MEKLRKQCSCSETLNDEQAYGQIIPVRASGLHMKVEKKKCRQAGKQEGVSTTELSSRNSRPASLHDRQTVRSFIIKPYLRTPAVECRKGIKEIRKKTQTPINSVTALTNLLKLFYSSCRQQQ